jgi:ArsR family transcriptional regulator
VAEASRLKILCLLQDGEHCVCEIVPAVKLSQSLVSHHLKDLKLAGLVTDEKRGMYVYYSLTSQGQKVTKLLFQLEKP